MTVEDGLGTLKAEMADLRTEVAALGSGIGHMLASQHAQTFLLEALLAAVADLGGDGGDDRLATALSRIADSLDAQSETLAGMRTGLAAIPRAVASAIGTSA